MDNAEQTYELWLRNVDASDAKELMKLRDDDSAIKDAFFRDLEFGTGGLRGIVGLGSNRMNIYTVRKATQGLANYLSKTATGPSVVIARDSRHMGWEFTKAAAEVLAANNIRVFIYPRIEPTPALSFAVRRLGCTAGICITASHNPAKYNGYKVYDSSGCQITTTVASKLQAEINLVDIFSGIKRLDFDRLADNGMISWVDDSVLDDFISAIVSQSSESAASTPLSVVYTPLHGTGLECVSKLFQCIGITDVYVEPKQAVPDENFSTCPIPNPEKKEALERGLALCKEKQADLLLASDPDADRLGVAVADGRGEYALLSGNEVGILLVNYLAQTRQIEHPVVVTTIVSTAMVDAMAKQLGFELRRTLTGFKYIGEQINLLESVNQQDRFLLGFEESYGYLGGVHVRDKDAVDATMLVSQMAQHYKAQGLTLLDVLGTLYDEYGYHQNSQVSVNYPGADGALTMRRIMAGLRKDAPDAIGGFRVQQVIDYSQGIEMPIINQLAGEPSQRLPKADVIEFQLESSHKVIIRPSGTEPKIKAYVFACGNSREEADGILSNLSEATKKLIS